MQKNAIKTSYTNGTNAAKANSDKSVQRFLWLLKS